MTWHGHKKELKYTRLVVFYFKSVFSQSEILTITDKKTKYLESTIFTIIVYWVIMVITNNNQQTTHSNPCLQWASILCMVWTGVEGHYICLLVSYLYNMGTFFGTRYFCLYLGYQTVTTFGNYGQIKKFLHAVIETWVWMDTQDRLLDSPLI